MFKSFRSRKNLRLTAIIVVILGLATAAWAAYYAYDHGFTKRWRRAINKELAKHGLEAKIGRLTLDPVEGLVARNVFLYDDPNQKRLLAKINRISLDIDFGKFARGENFLSKLDFKKANLSLPIDPARKKGKTIDIRNFNAQVLMENNLIELTYASGDFGDVEFHLRGSLLREIHPSQGNGAENSSPNIAPSNEKLMHRRYFAHDLALLLDKFSFDGPRPQLDIELNGKLNDPLNLHAIVSLAASNISRDNYTIQSLKASLESLNGEILLKHLIIADAAGEARLSGTHKIGSPNVDFRLESNAQLPALIRSLVNNLPLDEINFNEAPQISARGTYFIDQTQASTDIESAFTLPLPISAMGRIETTRVSAYGEEVDAECDFSIDRDRLYFQNVRLEDRDSGSADGDLLITPEETRYAFKLRLDPTPLGRFLPDGALKDTLARFSFDRDSSIQIEATGSRIESEERRHPWQHIGEVDLRNFVYNGQRFNRLEFDPTLNGSLLRMPNLRIEQGGGSAYDTEASINFDEKKLTLQGLTSTTLDPVHFLAAIDSDLARSLEIYQLESPPDLHVQGYIDYATGETTDLSVVITTKGVSGYPLSGEIKTFTNVAGSLQIKGSTLSLNLNGKTNDGFDYHGIHFESPATVAFSGSFPVGSDGAASLALPRYSVQANADDGATYAFAGSQLPLEGFESTVEVEGKRMKLAANANLHLGAVKATLDVADTNGTAYEATVHAEGIDFKSLAAQFVPNPETKGSLDFLFAFGGRSEHARAIEGDGWLKISDGNVFAIPLLGPLSPIVSSFYNDPPADFSVAKEAHATFHVSNGKLTADDFKATAKDFVFHVHGTADFVNNDLDLNASLRTRGVASILLYPVSRLFELHGSGTMADPSWRWLNRDQTLKENR
jgi:hypothetical protein